MKQLWKKGVCLLLGLTICASCTSISERQPVVITLMHGWGGSGADHVAMRQIYADFMLENPHIQLQFDASPDISVVINKANDMLAADSMPNIISTNGHAQLVANARKKRLALNLMPYVQADSSFAQDVGSGILSAWKNEDGTLYTIPDTQYNIGYWYNESLFRQAGITDTGTSRGTVTPPKTWTDFWNVCDKLAAIQSDTNAYPMAMQLDQLRILLGALLAAQDGRSRDFMQRNAQECDPADVEIAVAGLERAVGYYNGAPLSVGDARQLFFDGKTAIYLNGVWANTDFAEISNRDTIGYAAFPSSTGQTVAYVSPSSGYMVSRMGSPQQTEAAVAFLKYMMSEKTQKRIVQETKQAPASPKLTTEWIAQQAPILGNAVQVCYSAQVQILSLHILLHDRLGQELDVALQNLLLRKTHMEQFLSILSQKPIIS